MAKTFKDIQRVAPESNYVEPCRVVNGYRIFFRGYLPTMANVHFVGVAIAWPDIDEAGPFFACYALGKPRRYRGGYLGKLPTRLLTLADSLATFRRERAAAIRKLAEFIQSMKGKTCKNLT